MNTFSFLITSFIIILIPGTGVTYTISTGITNRVGAE
jgi:threonine/homoserine/homoserine lactone efflux protein